LRLSLQELELELLQLRLVPGEHARERAPAVFGPGLLLVQRASGAGEAFVVLLRQTQVERLDLLAQTIEPPGLPHLPGERSNLALDLGDDVVHARQIGEGQIELLERLLLSGL